MDKIMSLLAYYTFNKCWNDNIKDKEEGGPHCAGENNFYFKLFSNIIITLINLFIIYMFSKEKKKDFKIKQTKLNRKHKIIKKILGYLSILILLLQTAIKLRSRTVVFMLNPCHLSCIVSIILFFSKKKKPRIFNFLLSLLFGCTLGLLFPAFGFNYFPLKKEIFYLEHLVPFVASTYLYFIEYKDINFLSFKKHFEGFFYFSLYQRIVLWTFSELTWVNLNFTLCGNSVDPIFKYFGKYYLIFAEFYLSLGSYVTKSVLISFICIILKIRNKLRIKKKQ